MAINSLQLNESTPFAGLGTSTYNVLTTGNYTVSCNSTIPFVQGTSANSSSTVGQSGLVITINQNGSPVVSIGGSASNPTPTQPSLGTSARIQATAGDVLTVVLTSANSVDAVANAVKSIVNVYQGF
jgi:hypothetical protein